MQNDVKKIIRTSTLLTILGLLAVGCATQTGRTPQNYQDNSRFVPRIHVEDDSFGLNSMFYHGCSYDQMYDGYWCAK